MIADFQSELSMKSIRVSRRCRDWLEKNGAGRTPKYDSMALALVHMIKCSSVAGDTERKLDLHPKEIVMSAVPSDWLRYFVLRALLADPELVKNGCELGQIIKLLQCLADSSSVLVDDN